MTKPTRGRLVFMGIIAVVGVLFGHVQESAALSNQVPLGARGIAMGGAFSTLADDPTAIFWNPAGLADITQYRLLVTHANLFQSQINDNMLGLAVPLNHQALGFDFYNSSFDDNELGFAESRVDLCYARRVHRDLALGVNFKYLARNASQDGSNVSGGHGLGVDLGMLVNLAQALHVGIVVQDAANTSTSRNGREASAFPRNFRVASSYTPLPGVTLAADADDRFHLGGEAWLGNVLALRAGAEGAFRESDGTTWDLGVGVKLGSLRADFARSLHPVLASTSHVTVSWGFNIAPALIEFKESRSEGPIFASNYKSYASKPVARITLTNLQEKLLSTTIQYRIPSLMAEDEQITVNLVPGADVVLSIRPKLGPEALDLRDDRTENLRVTASYRSGTSERRQNLDVECEVYGRGEISWNSGIAPAAAFVTQADSVIVNLATRASAQVDDYLNAFHTPQIARAAAVCDALRTLKIRYEEDRNNPYSRISRSRSFAVDQVQYPRETLRRKAGDCDDTTALLAALLESIGIRTALVGVPGHIMLMMDSAIPADYLSTLPEAEQEMYVSRGGIAWLPLESTATTRGFVAMWQEGALILSRTPDTLTEISIVDTAQVRFPAGEVRDPDVPNLLLRGTELAVALRESISKLDTLQNQWYDQMQSKAQDTPRARASGVAQLVAHLVEAGHPELAKEKLEASIAALAATDSISAAILHNSLGATFTKLGDRVRAAAEFEIAARLDPLDPGLSYNRALIPLVGPAPSLDAASQFSRKNPAWKNARPWVPLESLSPDMRRGESSEIASYIERIFGASNSVVRKIEVPQREIRAAVPIKSLTPFLYWKLEQGSPR